MLKQGQWGGVSTSHLQISWAGQGIVEEPTIGAESPVCEIREPVVRLS